jgi:hypothetical protein
MSSKMRQAFLKKLEQEKIKMEKLSKQPVKDSKMQNKIREAIMKKLEKYQAEAELSKQKK